MYLAGCILQLLVKEVAEHRMRLKSGMVDGSGVIATPSSGGSAKARTGDAKEKDMASPKGSEPGSEGRTKRKKTQEEIDGFLKVRMGSVMGRVDTNSTTDKKVVIKTDFFGRQVKAKPKSVPAPATPDSGAAPSGNESGSGSNPKSKKYKKTGPEFVFKFQEGYSNAVRRTVRLVDLL